MEASLPFVLPENERRGAPPVEAGRPGLQAAVGTGGCGKFPAVHARCGSGTATCQPAAFAPGSRIAGRATQAGAMLSSRPARQQRGFNGGYAMAFGREAALAVNRLHRRQLLPHNETWRLGNANAAAPHSEIVLFSCLESARIPVASFLNRGDWWESLPARARAALHCSFLTPPVSPAPSRVSSILLRVEQ